MSFDNFQQEDVVPGEEQQGLEEIFLSESHIRFPVALEKALDLKNERIKESGVHEDDDGNQISRKNR